MLFRAGIVALMKRAMGGGAHRGPVAPTRQRRTIRFVQILLLLIAAGLTGFAGYSYGRADGFDAGKRAEDIDAPREPGVAQTAVLIVLGASAFGAALILQDGSSVRIPTPARLEEFADRAERVAVERAEEAASAERAT